MGRLAAGLLPARGAEVRFMAGRLWSDIPQDSALRTPVSLLIHASRPWHPASPSTPSRVALFQSALMSIPDGPPCVGQSGHTCAVRGPRCSQPDCYAVELNPAAETWWAVVKSNLRLDLKSGWCVLPVATNATWRCWQKLHGLACGRAHQTQEGRDHASVWGSVLLLSVLR